VLKAAERALKDAEAGEGARLAAAALGEADGILSAVDAEAARVTAANDLAIARRTRDGLTERAQREATEVERAREAIDKCVAAVVQTEATVAKLLADAKAVQDDLINKRIVLRHLFNKGLVAEQEAAAVRSFLQNNYSMPACLGQAERGNFDKHPAADPWKAAIAALASDADAPLPS
jgi:hypothetical protein